MKKTNIIRDALTGNPIRPNQEAILVKNIVLYARKLGYLISDYRFVLIGGLVLILLPFVSASVWNSTYEAGLISYYNMDYGSGSDVYDYYKLHNGTMNNGANYSVSGKVNNASNFDGSNDYINVEPLVPLGNNIKTIGAWFYHNSNATGTGKMLVVTGTTGADFGVYGLGLDETNRFFFYGFNSGDFVCNASYSKRVLNKWTYYVITSNGSRVTCYVDGVSIGYKDQSLNTQLSNLSIGRGVAPWTTLTFSGMIDEVGIWNRTLSSIEISNLYNDTYALVPSSPYIDNVRPIFYNYNEYPTDPQIYNLNLVINLSVNINSTNGTVGIEFNKTNYTLSNVSNVFNRSIGSLGAGVYSYYYWGYSNETNHYYNVSSVNNYTISKNQTVLSLIATSPLVYGEVTNFTGDGCNNQIVCNLNITNGVFSPGNISANYSTAGNSNYTGSSANLTILINKASSMVYTYINGSRANKNYYNGTLVRLNSSKIIGQRGGLNLSISGIQVNYSTVSNLSYEYQFDNVGSYIIRGNYEGNENYTSSYEQWTITISNPSATNSGGNVSQCRYKKFGFYNPNLPYFKGVNCI